MPLYRISEDYRLEGFEIVDETDRDYEVRAEWGSCWLIKKPLRSYFFTKEEAKADMLNCLDNEILAKMDELKTIIIRKKDVSSIKVD